MGEPVEIKMEVDESAIDIFMESIDFRDEIKPKIDIKEEPSEIKKEETDIENFVKTINFQDEIKPKIEVKKEPSEIKKEESDIHEIKPKIEISDVPEEEIMPVNANKEAFENTLDNSVDNIASVSVIKEKNDENS